jgi:uncharacterized protein
MKLHVKVMLLAAFIVAAGCSPLAPKPDYAKFFVLSPIVDAPTASSSTAPTDGLAIGIGPIDFPNYLKRLEVVTRVSPNRLDLSPVDRWGEPLDKNFERVLSENLAQLLNTGNIEKYPWPRRAEINYQIAIDVQHFETTTDGQSRLSARWIIKDGATGKDLYASQTSASAPTAPGDGGIATALSEDLGTLSRDIASQVSRLNQLRLAKGSRAPA